MQFKTPKSIKLKGIWSPKLLVSVVRAECPSRDPIYLSPDVGESDQSVIQQLGVSGAGFTLQYNNQGMKKLYFHNASLLASFMFLKLQFQHCKGKCLSFGLLSLGYYKGIAGLHSEIYFFSFVKSIAYAGEFLTSQLSNLSEIFFSFPLEH